MLPKQQLRTSILIWLGNPNSDLHIIRLRASKPPVRREHQIVFDITVSKLLSVMKSLFRVMIPLTAKGSVERHTREDNFV